MLMTILLIILILALLGSLPSWRYSREWGYGPSGDPAHPLAARLHQHLTRPREPGKWRARHCVSGP